MEEQKQKKKNKKILGIPVALFVIGILAVGGVSAALVGYLSNNVKAEVTVESPIQQWISTSEGGWIEEIFFGSVHGGETVTFYTKEQNLADVSIEGNVESIVTGPEITCADFESVVVNTRTPETGYAGEGHDLIGLDLCVDVDDKVVFGFPGQPMNWDAGQVDINKIVVTFKTNAEGTYTFTNRIVPVVPVVLP